MAKTTAEEALRATIDSSLKGDTEAMMSHLAPEGVEGVRRMRRALAGLPKVGRFNVETTKGGRREQQFKVLLKTSARDVEAKATLRQIKGDWLVTNIEPEGESDDFEPHSAEDLLRAVCDAALKGNGQFVSDRLTSAAFVDVMKITSAWGILPVPQGYDLEFLGEDGEDSRFVVKFKSGEHTVDVASTVKQVKGTWKVASMKLPGIRE